MMSNGILCNYFFEKVDVINKALYFQGGEIRDEVNGGCEIPGLKPFCHFGF